MEFVFVSGPRAAAPNELTSTYAPLVEELQVGDRVMLADGTVSMVVEAKSPAACGCGVVQRGTIRSRQGINLPGVKLSVPAISDTDHEHAIWAAQAGVDFVGLSFVRSPDEVRSLKDILRSCGSTARVVAKIEKREALEQLEEIVAEADAVMVARGDLGVEIDVAQMPIEQKRIIAMCHRFQRPVIIATQMLDSMHDSPRPTRAEATDVANAILDGADACMLSGETAVGNYPLEAVEMMNRIALATESSLQSRPPQIAEGDVRRSCTTSRGPSSARPARWPTTWMRSWCSWPAIRAARRWPCRSIAALCRRWASARSEATLRQMCLYWGVTPLRGAPARDMQELIRHADDWACRAGYATKGDRIVIVGGSHLAAGPRSRRDGRRRARRGARARSRGARLRQCATACGASLSDADCESHCSLLNRSIRCVASSA